MAGDRVDLDAIKVRTAIRPGALLTALRCVPDGEIRHGCVISDGTQTKDAIRAAYHAVHTDVPALVAEVERLRTELGWWESGRRRKGMPVVEAVPDGLAYAAALARAQGAEGGEEHDQLLAEAAQRLKALTDTASALLAETVMLRAELDPDTHRDTEPWARRLFEQRDAAVTVASLAKAWRDDRGKFPLASPRDVSTWDLIAAVDAAWPDRRIADLDRAHVEALYDDLYRDWPGKPGLAEPDGAA